MTHHPARSGLWGMFSSNPIIPLAISLLQVGSEKGFSGVKITRLSFRLVNCSTEQVLNVSEINSIILEKYGI